jgi:N-acetylglucosaminyldiphosphoundecaprenol N-acetyl-beta-D-mannosaminyltransferase
MMGDVQSCSAGARPPIAILGVPFDNITTAEAVAAIDRMVASRRPHYLATANVDFLVQALEDVELHRILFDAHLVLCDGTPLVWASHLLGNPLPQRVAGSDIVPLLLGIAAKKGYRIFFLGAAPDVVAQAVKNLEHQYPDLIVAGYYSPPFKPLLEMDHDEITRRIAEAKPDLLFVGFGCPKQEKWIAMHYQSLGVPVSVGIGGTIDFLAGRLKRAPVWMQRTGTEWIYRMLQEPRRLFGRYAKDLWIFGRNILRQWWRLQFHARRRKPATDVPAVRARQTWQSIRLPRWFDLGFIRENQMLLKRVVIDGRHCLLEMDRVEFIDSSGVGALVRLEKELRFRGRQLILLAPSKIVKRTVELMRLQDFFLTAPNLPAAQHLIEQRGREESAAVTPRTAAAVNPLMWRGELTAANADKVWDLTRAHLAPAAAAWRHDLVLDLAGLRFIDSTGVGVMLRAKKAAQREGQKVKFINLQPPVRNVLRISRLEAFLLDERTEAYSGQ